jgi:hypothetical protein
VPAFEVLKEILQEGEIVGSGSSGYLKGSRTASAYLKFRRLA